MVGGFLGKYRSEGGIFRGESGFGFRFLSGCREFSSGGQLGDDRRSCQDETGSASNDSMDDTVLLGTGDVFALRLPVVVGEEVSVGDGIDVYMSWGFDGGLDEVGFVAFGIGGEREEEFLGLVKGLFDRDGLVDPVDGGVDIFQPGEPQDNVFIS